MTQVSGGGGTDWVNKNKKVLPTNPPRMTSDERFRKFIADKSRQQTVRRVGPTPISPVSNAFEEYRRGERGQAPLAPINRFQLPIIRKDDNRPSPSNPFGERLGRTPTALDRPMPNITPQIRAMALPGATFLDTDKVTPDYIKDVAHQDNDLAKHLARNYMDEYSRRLINGYTGMKPLDNATIDELNKLGERPGIEDFFKGVGNAIGGGLKLIQEATRAPIKTYGYGVLSTGFEHQPKTIDPTKVKPGELDTLGIANVDLDKLPPYYSGQLKSGLSRNFAQDIEKSVRQYHPDWLGPVQPDPDPEKDKVYQGIVDKVFKERQDWDYYAKFFTPSDIPNTFFSTPGIRQAYVQGNPLTKEQESNILGTSGVAGLTASEKRVQFAKAMKDAGVPIEDEDATGFANGWSADTVNKYAALLKDKGVNLPDLVMQNTTWPELKRALDLMRWPAEEQADIARSLGYKVTVEPDKPIFVQTYNDYGVPQQEEKSREFVFNVHNPDMTVSLNDIRTKADIANVDRGQFADMLAMKYTYAALADVKTVPFQDLAADLTLDPTNFGKLQLIWAPLGEVFKLGGKAVKELAKGMYYSGAFMGDVGVGALKTIGNLIGKTQGVESKLFKPEDWRHVTDAAHYLTSESAQSVVNKITNRAFFVTKSIMPTEYTKDGDTLMYWVENVLPNMQEAAQTGDWSAFAREVPVGAGEYAASGLNAISRDLSRIAGDKDAFGRFADNLSKLFSDEIGADDVKVLQKLAENGDYAGITSWLANKHIAHKIFSNIDPGEARHSLDASDLINHVTSAYRSGINVLTEKSMGVFDKEISPLALRINDTLSSLSRFWTNAVLTVRPGWNAINKVDNDARLLANGFDPSASAMAFEKKLTELGVTPVQMREIIYGGNFLDEAIRLNVPVTPEMVEAVKYARKVTVSSEKKQFENLVELARRASASLERLPAETRRPMEDVVHKLSVEADKLVKNQGDVKAVRDAADKVDNLANQMFGKTATVDTPLFRSRLANMKEYVNTLKGGDGFLISRIWNNFVNTGHAVHRDIEAAARMRVFAPTFIEKYHEALKTLSRDLPTFPDEAQLAQRFANIVDPRARDEAIREATMAYSDVQARLRGLVNEAALHPNKLPEVQAYLDELRSNPLSAARNFIYGNQPIVDGMTPAADILMQEIGDVMTSTFDGMSLADMSDKAKVSEALRVAYERSLNRIKTRDASANLAARTNEIMKPSTKVPDAAVNWLQDQQITNLSDIETTIKRMEKIASDVEGVNQEFRDSFLELNHEPYLDTLDRIQRQLPGRAHRYDLMRDSFGEKFSGEARYGSETVQLVGGTMDKTRGVSVTLSDGRIVPADAIQIDDAQRAWYFKQYTKWEKAKPSGNNILTRSGIGGETGAGLKMRKPVYAATGEAGMVPPDVARSYVRKMEDDVVSHGGIIPTEYVDADGVKHALAYDDPQDFVNRFMSGSGLGYYKAQGGHFNLIEGIQRTADNWTYLARVSDATSMDELADVYINGKRVTDIYPKDANVAEVKKRIFSDKSAKVSVRYERNGMQVPPLTNDPSRGETLTDVTRRLWKDKVEGVYIETRGQWVPVFNPNAKAGERISFQKIGQDSELSSLRIPVDTGTSIPDEMGESLLKAQDAAEPVATIGNDVESAMTRLDNLLKAAPERPPFKADSLVGGREAMSTGKMQRMEDGSRGIEVVYADGSNDLVPVRDIQFLPPEKPAVTAADQSLEQVYADLGLKTPAQVATIAATDPISEFIKRHPRVNTRADLLDRVAFLREHGVPIQDEQVMAMADLLEAASVHMFHQEPDFLLKRVNLTPFAPDSGLYQLAEESQKMTRVGWLTNEERQQVFDQAIREGKAPAEAMAKAAEGYPAAQGLVGAQGEPLFETGPQGEMLGAFKMIFDRQNGPLGMIHFGPGATRETVAHEFAHFIQGMAELPEQLFEGPEMRELRKEIRKQLDVVLEATGAPRLEYAGERGPKKYRYVSYQNLYKVDREASNLVDEDKWAKFVEQSRQSNERFAKHFTAYLATGKAPTKELSGVFKRFKEWLVEMFQARRASGERIPVEVKRIFDQWLTENPDWKRQLTKKGKEFLSPEKQAIFEQATKASGQLDDWKKAVDNLKVAYGGWNDSPAIDEFDRVANEAYAKLQSKADAIVTPEQQLGESFIDSPQGERLGKIMDDIEKIDLGEYKLADKRTMEEVTAELLGEKPATKAKKLKPEVLAQRRKELVQEARDIGVPIEDETKAVDAIDKFFADIESKEAPTGWSYAKDGTSLASYTDVQVINALTAEGNGYRFIKPDTLREIGHRYNSLSEDHKALVEKFMAGYSPERDELRYFEQGVRGTENVVAETGAEGISDIMAPVWDAYTALLQDGKFHPKKLVDGNWVYPEGGEPLTTLGKFHAGKPTPPAAQNVGYLTQTVDDILAKEKGTPASLDELAALNAPNSTFVSPELVEVMKYHAGTKAYLDQWFATMNAAVEGGFLPGKTMRGLSPEDIDLTQKWLNDKYSQLSHAATVAQQAAEDKTKLVMMDFETTYNADTLMQQGPALPSWAGQLAGVRPLRVGGIVPFFKFPRENIESWVNTLGNHPALFHNIARYQEEGNIERKSLGLSSQLLPVWPVRVGDKVVSVSPFAFISLGQMIRPFNPYIDEDATNVDNAVNVANQMGFSLGPTLRLTLRLLNLTQDVMPILPQPQALIPPQQYQYISEPLKWLLGLKSMRDEFYVNRQIVFDGLADLNIATSEGSKQQILKDMANAIQMPDHPRRIAATDHYYTMRFDTSNTGYWTGLYPREISKGELDLKQYKTDIAQLRSAMVSAGLSPDQVDLIESYMQGDPRAEANRRLNSLYNADKSQAISDTETEAWADSVATAGKRSEYYEQRALIEAEFQQKYGFSGTAMSDADREDYNKRIFALNKKYEDVLTQRKLTKQPWQTDEDYHRGLSAMWLEYLNGTRPQFTNYKTYAEYQTAVDQWEKNLPKISRSMWSKLNAPLSSVTTSNISALPGYLDAVSNKQSIDLFRSKYDTVSEAIYSTLRDKYYSGYWDAVTGKVGARRLLAEMEYNSKHPVPDEAAIQKWLADGIYQGRFTKQDVARELKAHSVADIRNSILSGKDLPHRQALEISDLLSRIPPGKAYFAFLDTLPGDVRKYYDAYQVDSYTPLDSPTKWSALYQYIVPALKGNFPEPTINMVREWVTAVDENDMMQALRERKFPGIKSTLDEYNTIDKLDKTARKQFRNQHPEIGHYYDWLYTDWQNAHPTWQKYYGSDTTSANRSTGATARPNKTSYVKGKVHRYSTGGKRYYGGGSYSYSPTSAQSKAAQDAWNNFRSMAGPALYDKLISHWETQAAFSADELSLLQSLYKQYGFGAKDFNDWVENILPAMRSAMIPGTSIFERQPNYSQMRQPQFRTGYNWFGRGKNAA